MLNRTTLLTCLFFQPSRCCEMEEIFRWKKIKYPSTNYFLYYFFFFFVCLSVCLTVCLSARHSLSPWAVAGCLQRKRCGPSGVVINMLDGEQVFGRGNMKKYCALNTQHNSGVHYNWENRFLGGEGRANFYKDNKSCGNFFSDNRKNRFSPFPFGNSQQSGVLLGGKKKSHP